MAAMHRQVTALALEQGWKPPGDDHVRQIIKNLDPVLVTLAHQGEEKPPEVVGHSQFKGSISESHRADRHNSARWQADLSPHGSAGRI